MSNWKRTRPLILVLGLVFVCTNIANGQTSDDEILQSITKTFFDAYKRKDVDALVALWKVETPELSAFTADARQTFSAVGNIEIENLEFRRIVVNGSEAVVRVRLKMHATDSKSAQPAKGFGQMNRTLRLIKDGSVWKVSNYEPSERELAVALLFAKTENERAARLESEKELVTPELVMALRRQMDIPNQKLELAQVVATLHLIASMGEKFGDENSMAFALNNLGVLYFSHAQYQQALDAFEKQLSLGATSRDRVMTARTLHNVGTIKRLVGDYAAALDYLSRSIRVGEEIGDKKALCAVLNSIGIVYREQGNYAQALAYLERSLTVCESISDKFTTGLALNNIGTIHGSQGNHVQALEYFQRSLQLAQTSTDKVAIANALNNIGISYYSQRDYARALDYYEQSLALREHFSDKRMAAQSLNNIGIIHREQGDYSRALDYYRRSLAIREKLDDYAGIATALNHIGIVHYLQGDFAQALQIANRVIDIAKRLAIPELLWRGYELAGRAQTSLSQFDEAEKALTNSIDTIERMRYLVGGGELARQRFFEDKLPPYRAMVDLAFKRNRAADALTFGEMAKARTLLDVLRNGRIQISKAMSRAEQETERTANAELNTLNAQIYEENQRPKPNPARIAELEPRREKARLAHEAFLTGLYVKHPELKVQRGEATPITSAEANALLPDASTALVEFVVGEEKSYLIVMTRDRKTAAKPDIALYELQVTSKQLLERVNKFREMLAERDLSYQESARELYDLLLKPAESQLRGRKTLCVVPDQSLWELPFQALQSRSGVHLIEEFTLFYVPSLSVMREVLRKRSDPTRYDSPVGVVEVSDRGASRLSKTLLALGNPQLSGDNLKVSNQRERFGPLPEAEREVKTLIPLYGAANTRVLIGPDAREGVVKTEAPKYQILHFATHALLDNRNPMFSFLTMAQTAGDANDDGLLEAREIINMDLRAELAVLSACQTARGWVGAGEGVIGMSWALFVAGVPTTVASQWKVDSASTTSLMIDFHRRLKMRRPNARSRETKAESLRQATLGLLRSERYKHPFYWAGFVMVGDGW